MYERKYYSYQEFKALEPNVQAYAAAMGYVPENWYDPEEEEVETKTLTTATGRNYDDFNWYYSSNYDDCHDTLVKVEDAIRESNPVLQETPHLINRG